ncbi:MAG: M48 family metallopeptidase [Gammaproteobacteria bacterium]
MNGQLALDFDSCVVTERRSPKARHIRIEVRRGGEVLVVIPRSAGRGEAHAFLRDRQDWVRRKIAEWRLRAAPAALPRPELRWDGMDRFPLRGADVPLRLMIGDPAEPCVRFDEGITVFAPAPLALDPACLQRCLKRALIEEARRGAVRALNEESARLGLAYTALRIGDPSSQWGSCGSNGRISLSWRLLLAPPAVLRYVVIHELCHLRWRGHGPRFWSLVAQQMRDHEAHRSWLREQGAGLHMHLVST